MTITDVWVRKITKEGKLKAIVSITLDNEFVVHDIKSDIMSCILIFFGWISKSYYNVHFLTTLFFSYLI